MTLHQVCADLTVSLRTVDIVARRRAVGAACPDCGRLSDRVHDSYRRKLKDLPIGQQSVVPRRVHVTLGR
ncbi:transposase family protein [Streptomyces cyaneus]|uniref:transposase family protein n=1 Tax=Streptomyces cyaneus TaxID=1904 RepID=UPI000FF88E9C|nr:transposase family protein [Streptomyces cyaneus]